MARILLAKVGLDGHDRGIKVVARGLRDAGFHVIYGGIWQSPEAVSQAVADEDADWLGISLLSGAHMTLMPRLLDQLRQDGLDDVGVVLGGIVPEADVPKLREMGVAAVFGPGTDMQTIAGFLRERAVASLDSSELWDRCGRQDRRALAQLLTSLCDSRQHEVPAEEVPAEDVEGGRMQTIAFTGSPGVGKSSLIAKLLPHLRERRLSVAVLACDPQSPYTGGALLGDRIRMAESQPDPNVFIRSIAVPSGSQGVTKSLQAMTSAFERFGFDVLLVETVGVGQGDVAVREAVDRVALLLQPEAGDSVQWEKAGLLEAADVVVIQKADLPGADQTETELRHHLNLPGCRQVPVVRVSAAKDEGLDELWSRVTAVISDQ